MLDHLGVNVSDYDRSRDLYGKALEPLGCILGAERQVVMTDEDR